MRQFLNELSHQDLHSVSDFRLKPQFASMDMSKFKDGKVHFKNSGVKGSSANKIYRF